MNNQKKILDRIKKFDLFVKGANNMSEEQTKAFNNLISGRQIAFATSLFLDDQELPFLAADDQLDAYQKEYNCQVKFRIQPGTFFIEQIENK